MLKVETCPTCGARRKRSNEQNKLYWALLHEIESIVELNCVTYSADTWHIYFRQRFLGCEDIKLPNGKVLAHARSTTDLKVNEMTNYITQVEQWAAEMGVFQS